MEALDSGEDGKNSNKAKMMSIGRKKFNMDPKKGIEFLIEKGLLQQTPESVAQFLHKGEGLNKTAIGDYLGEKNDFNEKVLQAFVDLHDFTDLILVQALRWVFCWLTSGVVWGAVNKKKKKKNSGFWFATKMFCFQYCLMHVWKREFCSRC